MPPLPSGFFPRGRSAETSTIFSTYDEQSTGIAIGDVSGKAAPAALYAALTSGIMRAAAAQHPSPATMLKLLNESLHERKVDSQYVSHGFCGLE